MIVSTEQLIELMKKPRNGEAISSGVRLQNKHKVHVTGEGYKKLVSKVEGYEGSRDLNVRMQVSKPATIDIASIILDNLNRWVSAQGTVKKIAFKDDEQRTEDFKNVLNKVWRGESLEHFISTFYKNAIYTEFNGFIVVTKPKIVTTEQGTFIEKDGVLEPKPDGNLNPYLIFVAAEDTYDFHMTGSRVEYLILKYDVDTYRLLDDEKDVVFTFDKNKNSFTNWQELPNEIGYTPAKKISNIDKNLVSSQVKTSPIDHIVPALDRYFSSDSDLRMQFIKHNYPKLAIVSKECNECNGTGKSYKDETEIKCGTCDGSGVVIPISRDGVIALPQYLNQGDTAYPGTPASYITPDTDSLRLGIEDLDRQKTHIVYSGTGDKNLIGESLNTATENMINSKSLEDRIREITMMVEGFEEFVVKTIKKMHKSFQNASDFVVSIRYGKRIGTKSEGELITEIQESKKAGMPISYINSLNKDIIYAKYKNNTEELHRQLVLSDIEPLSGFTVAEINDIKDNLDPQDMYLKLNFDSIISELELTDPITYTYGGGAYAESLRGIKEKVYEILQERIRARSGDSGESMETTTETGAED